MGLEISKNLLHCESLWHSGKAPPQRTGMWSLKALCIDWLLHLPLSEERDPQGMSFKASAFIHLKSASLIFKDQAAIKQVKELKERLSAIVSAGVQYTCWPYVHKYDHSQRRYKSVFSAWWQVWFPHFHKCTTLVSSPGNFFIFCFLFWLHFSFHFRRKKSVRGNIWIQSISTSIYSLKVF